MNLLYLVATFLFAAKVTTDLDAFTPESKRRVDLFAFFLIGLVLIVLASAMPANGKPVQPPCFQVCGWSVI